MSYDSAALLAIWSVLLMVTGALISRIRLAGHPDRPVPQPLRRDAVDYDLDGPVIDMEPA